MKNKILLLLLVLLTLVGLGCNTPTHIMHIEGKDKIIINQSEQLKVIYQGTELPLENLEWTLSDYEIASIENGVFYAKDYGVVVVGVIDKTNTLNYCSKTIEIVPPYVEDIVINGLGFVKIIFAGNVKIYANKDIEIFTRKSLI